MGSPGFTAEATLYRGRRHYALAHPGVAGEGNMGTAWSYTVAMAPVEQWQKECKERCYIQWAECDTWALNDPRETCICENALTLCKWGCGDRWGDLIYCPL